MTGRLRAFGIATTALLALYPIAVWIGITRVGGRVASLVVLGLLAVLIPFRIGQARRFLHLRKLIGPYLILGLLALLAAVLGDQRFLLFMPVLINAGLLMSFGGSLGHGCTPIVESFARVIEDTDLPLEKVSYCRWVTRIWCAFFLFNGLAALWLAVFGPFHVWVLYTGFVSYLLSAALFGGEYAVRRIRFG